MFILVHVFDSVTFAVIQFLQQHRHYQALVQVFQHDPSHNDKSFEALVMFLAQICQCYPDELKEYPNELMNLLKLYSTVLHPEVRLVSEVNVYYVMLTEFLQILCKALILLRNKGLLLVTDLLSLFFELLRCNDKHLRTFLRTHIVTDIKNMNAKHKDAKLNTVSS